MEKVEASSMKEGDVLIRPTGNRHIMSIDENTGGFITYRWYYTAHNPNIEVDIRTSRIWNTALVRVERGTNGERE
jgi:hypothetical protein